MQGFSACREQIMSFHEALSIALLGTALGMTLFFADFGFTGAYRRMILFRDGSAVMPQFALLVISSVLFAPVLAQGGIGDLQVTGAYAPVSVSVAIGAFLFGVGMQLAGGCGSGTLYALGRGSLPMLLALPAFCFGGFWASLHSWWVNLPSAGTIVLGERLGWPLAVLLQSLFILLCAWLVRRYVHQDTPPMARSSRDPWSWWKTGLVLGGLSLLLLLAAGHPWSITWAFTLWAAKVAVWFGWNPASAPFWQGGFQEHALQSSVFQDSTSLMDMGLILGVFAAAWSAGQLVFRLKVSARTLLAALAGGLLMGYGSRIAYGCNIGAFVSGISSTSLHGWLWILLALPGNWLGVSIRQRLDL